jgi:hypothetical protein
MGEKISINGDVEKSAVQPNVEQEKRLSSGQSETSKKGDGLTTHDASTEDDNLEYPTGAKAALIMISNFLAVFHVALVSSDACFRLL